MQVKPLKKESSELLKSPLEEQFTSFLLASDDKRALRGRQSTSLICSFCVILICFVGNCPNMMRKSGKKSWSSLTRRLARFVLVSNTQKELNWQRGGTTRACRDTTVREDIGQKANFSLHLTNCELSTPLFLLFFVVFLFFSNH